MIRLANSGSVDGCERQKSRTQSLKCPFHSDQFGGNPPTWYPPEPKSHGSAMSLTREIIGSCCTMSKNADSLSTSWNWRARVAAKSKRNPSTCISCTQYRSESVMSCRVCGERISKELPVPVVSK